MEHRIEVFPIEDEKDYHDAIEIMRSFCPHTESEKILYKILIQLIFKYDKEHSKK